jgi:uncharacterized protein YutE (UPF0331/DUF86 family)
MNEIKWQKLLEKYIQEAEKASVALEYSHQKCLHLKAPFDLEQQEGVEALAARFARLIDIMLQKVWKTIEKIELDEQPTTKDRILVAEKKQIIENASLVIQAKQLRNQIAHDYAGEELEIIFSQLLQFVPAILLAWTNTKKYIQHKQLI